MMDEENLDENPVGKPKGVSQILPSDSRPQNLDILITIQPSQLDVSDPHHFMVETIAEAFGSPALPDVIYNHSRDEYYVIEP